jgi:hypothetical protein
MLCRIVEVRREFLLASVIVIFAIVVGAPVHAALFLLAEWTCTSPSTGQQAGGCESLFADDVGGGVIKYSSAADIPIEPQLTFPPNQQPNAGNSFTFEFNQKDVPPFNGINDTTKNESIEGEIEKGIIETTKISDEDIQLIWDSIYPGSYDPLPADWARHARGGTLIGGVELHYDPVNSNYITRLVVSVFSTVPEPSTGLLLGIALLGLWSFSRSSARRT